MDDKKTEVKLFFEELGKCASDMKGNWKSSDIRNLFRMLGEHFAAMDAVERIDWKDLRYNMFILPEMADDWDGGSEALSDDYTNSAEIVHIGHMVPKLEEKLISYDDWMERFGDGEGCFTWVMMSKYCGYDVPDKSYSQSGMAGKKDAFAGVIKELDENDQIKNIFCYKKESRGNEKWYFNAVDSERFYQELDGMRLEDQLSVGVEKKLHARYCKKDGWKTKYERMNRLLNLFSASQREKEPYFSFEQYTVSINVLCDLVPVVYFADGGQKKIKEYDRWRGERELIAKIIRSKETRFRFDEYERKIYELVCALFDEISEKADRVGGNYDGVADVIKLWYLEWTEEASKAALVKIDAMDKLLLRGKKENITENTVKDFLYDITINLKL